MKSRILTGAAIIAAITGFFFLGATALFYMLLTINAFALAEYTALVYKRDASDFILCAFLGTALLVSARLYGEASTLPVYTASVFLLFAKDILRGRTDFSATSIGTWGFTAVSLSTALAVFVLEQGIYFFGLVIAATAACDISAYFGGTWIGRHKLCPNISPKKTVEGSIIGCLFSCAIYGMAALLYPAGYPPAFLIGCGLCCGAFSQFGDLAMSMAKRHYGVKDFSSLLPGHGGVLDRVDAMLFSFSSVYCLIRFFRL
jgi:phosphatidate cytidylyltransferase